MQSYLLEFNLLVWFFVCLGTLVNVLSLIVNGRFPLSRRLKSIFLYGKASAADEGSCGHNLLADMTVPKHWFSHFYALGSVWSVMVWSMLAREFLFSSPPPPWLSQVLSWLTAGGHVRLHSVPVLLAATLLCLQTARRMYEHARVLVQSDSRMHVSHYIAGLAHYSLAPMALVAGHGVDRVNDISAGHWVAVCVFLTAWREQHLALSTLAALRGPGGSGGHGLPRGRLFSLVSCPHYTAELVMYASLWWLLDTPRCWGALLYWVVSNQLAAALMSHHWYIAHFDRHITAPHAVLPYLL